MASNDNSKRKNPIKIYQHINPEKLMIIFDLSKIFYFKTASQQRTKQQSYDFVNKNLSNNNINKIISRRHKNISNNVKNNNSNKICECINTTNIHNNNNSPTNANKIIVNNATINNNININNGNPFNNKINNNSIANDCLFGSRDQPEKEMFKIKLDAEKHYVIAKNNAYMYLSLSQSILLIATFFKLITSFLVANDFGANFLTNNYLLPELAWLSLVSVFTSPLLLFLYWLRHLNVISKPDFISRDRKNVNNNTGYNCNDNTNYKLTNNNNKADSNYNDININSIMNNSSSSSNNNNNNTLKNNDIIANSARRPITLTRLYMFGILIYLSIIVFIVAITFTIRPNLFVFATHFGTSLQIITPILFLFLSHLILLSSSSSASPSPVLLSSSSPSLSLSEFSKPSDEAITSSMTSSTTMTSALLTLNAPSSSSDSHHCKLNMESIKIKNTSASSSSSSSSSSSNFKHLHKIKSTLYFFIISINFLLSLSFMSLFFTDIFNSLEPEMYAKSNDSQIAKSDLYSANLSLISEYVIPIYVLQSVFEYVMLVLLSVDVILAWKIATTFNSKICGKLEETKYFDRKLHNQLNNVNTLNINDINSSDNNKVGQSDVGAVNTNNNNNNSSDNDSTAITKNSISYNLNSNNNNNIDDVETTHIANKSSSTSSTSASYKTENSPAMSDKSSSNDNESVDTDLIMLINDKGYIRFRTSSDSEAHISNNEKLINENSSTFDKGEHSSFRNFLNKTFNIYKYKNEPTNNENLIGQLIKPTKNNELDDFNTDDTETQLSDKQGITDTIWPTVTAKNFDRSILVSVRSTHPRTEGVARKTLRFAAISCDLSPTKHTDSESLLFSLTRQTGRSDVHAKGSSTSLVGSVNGSQYFSKFKTPSIHLRESIEQALNL
ncbi:hypothetical protein HELRODRAFT_166378 [Helobdella robusta]|uniref:Uncharacterized protein n=1 Tax=Helobdella robusta TaxID=6412 RepID=T1EY26_HELRO|nr:hypothetical protein HELRODRAFT_166378 [Helobdella robusta]ESN90674.1 hypothetical protein HELRODRAFT_166378 [Helobdella robusta]